MELDPTFGGYCEGIHYGISDKEYRKIRAISSSLLKESFKSMKHAKAMIEGKKKSSATMELGKLIHMAILEPSVYKEKVIETDLKSKALKAYKEMVKENYDKTVLNAKETYTIRRIIESVGQHQTAPKTIKEGSAEVCVFAIHPELNIPLKGKLDFLNLEHRYILDLKTASQIGLPFFMNDAARMKYHVQAAFYIMLLNILKEFGQMYYILALEKEEPFDAVLYELGFESMDKGRELIDMQLPKLKFAIENNKWPGFSDEPLRLSLPNWAFNEGEYD